ncbi:MAG: glutamine synthetase family protein [Spirochaetia bacterium]|nr:glutamine synthetase family protein [Spirochaetia bacterium]
MDAEQLRQGILKGSIDTVIVAFPDQFGQLMGKRITGEYYLENSTVESCSYLLTTDIEMQPQDGYAVGSWEQGYGDFRIAADPACITIPAWSPATALIIGDLIDRQGQEVAQSPRAVFKAQLERARDLSSHDRSPQKGFVPMAASELEFYLFNNSYKAVRNSGYAGVHPASSYPVDYHILGTGYDEELIGEIRRKVSASGIPVESSKGETGLGQYEIALRYAEALEAADRHIIYKWGAKTIAASFDRSISFMAKYSDQDAGSSCHVHLSLWGAKASPEAPASTEIANLSNLFWDEKTGAGSQLFRYFLGGLHALAPELFLFFAPTINSYKRYTSASFAPVNSAWDYDNRTTGFRVVGGGSSFRIENRLPGADANPYLAYAATLAAGLYGIEHKIECPEPFSGNAYSTHAFTPLPANLAQAAENLSNSVAARSIFGDQVVEHYVHQARLEAKEYARVVGEWELKRYFERI